MSRALSHDARLIVMDEPSAVLAHDEVENLFRVIRDLIAQGVAVVYISHRLEEIRQIGDVVTVLKDGRTVATRLPAASTPTQQLVSLMTGRRVEYLFPEKSAQIPQVEPLLTVEGLGLKGAFEDVSLSVRPGEIVGIAGLVGSGRSELLETIYGARRADTGTIRVAGRALRPGSVGSAVRAGVGMAPEERKSQALLLDEPIYRNVTLARFARFARGGFTRAGSEASAAADVAARLDLRPPDVRRPVRQLSGGNQQKVVVGRWLVTDGGSRQAAAAGRNVGRETPDAGPGESAVGEPADRISRNAGPEAPARAAATRLLILDEPTRGVDVGARSDLYQLIRGLAEAGLGVLLVSSEVPEVLGLADRVLIMREGSVIHEAPGGALDEETVLDMIMAGSLTTGALAAETDTTEGEAA